MLGEGYDELVARGVPLQVVYAREGMWATSGRALWRRSVPATRFVVRYFDRWNGTLVTTVFGLKSSAPLMSSARWLCSRCCHHLAGTNSGRITVT